MTLRREPWISKAAVWMLNRSAILGIPLFMPVLTVAQDLHADSLRTISFHSVPDSVEVTVDSSVIGTTPCQYTTTRRIHAVTYRKDGFRPRTDTVVVQSAADTSISIRLYRPGAVYLTSIPDSAVVFMGSHKVGWTPLLLSDLDHDSVMLSVIKTNCDPWRTTIIPPENDTAYLCARLPNRSARLGVFVIPGRAQVFIDDKLVDRGSVAGFVTSEGAHKITVRDDSTGRTADQLVYSHGGTHQFYRARMGVNSLERGFLTAIFPGSAQLTDGAFLEGTALLVGNLALGYLALQAQADYKDRLSAYDAAVKSYIAAPTEIEAYRRHEDVSDRKSDLDRSYARRTVSYTLFAAAYIYALADAILHHLTTDVIEVVPLTELPATPLGSSDDGLPAGVQLKVKF